MNCWILIIESKKKKKKKKKKESNNADISTSYVLHNQHVHKFKIKIFIC